ncbi:shikimate dehydrogenase [Motiliproteus sediminis]|uniref:shikimate dehydrogenase n=1 Tax=Motiliproteus sediminis TaxID=1468178 RepID=UPI001AEF4A52|nr:shikimate dehydrogenase [Motiliproteus sediminis]
MTDQYAVVGNPIEHSKSPLIHAAFAAATGQDLEYAKICAPLDDFAGCVEGFRLMGGKGLNVTVPFKLEAFRLATKLTERARSAEAVNTLKFDGDEILGDNTDGEGLVQDILGGCDFTIEGRRVLVLGAGGATQGILLPLIAQRPAALMVVNRTAAKADALKAHVVDHFAIDTGGFEAIEGREFDLVINATSASLSATALPIAQDNFASGSLAYDLAYGNEETVFMRQARVCGAAQVADGLGMLVGQAAESFYLWRGVRPQTAAVIEQLRQQQS